MKHASILLLLTLAACGDSKPEPAPTKPATPDVGVTTTPDEPVATEPAVTPPAVVDTPVPDAVPVVEATTPSTTEAVETKDEPKEDSTTASKPKSEATETKKSEDSTAKPAETAATPAKVEELSVQVLEEGTGAVVKRGDTVTLEYTISYMPKPEKKDDAKKKDSKGSKKSDAKKSDEKKGDEKKTDDAKPKDEHKDADKPADEKKEDAATEPKENGVEKPADEKPADAKPPASDTKPSEAKKDETKSAEAKPIEPLKPVIVASTKSFPIPFTVKLTETGKPKLMPGLVRGVEGLKVGTRARILVPAALAYGKDGNKSAGIPPETPLEIEVFVRDARE